VGVARLDALDDRERRAQVEGEVLALLETAPG